MKYYQQLIKIGCFTWAEFCDIVGNPKTADSLARNYLNKGFIKSVKRGLYTAIDLATGEPVVNKFRIAGKITPSSYVSHHSAFEYYGCANQVSYQTIVSSDTTFSEFIFNGITYSFIGSRINNGIHTCPDNVRVTDIERTILDGINDYEKVMGLEELLRCIELIPLVKEDKLIKYLADYDKQVLYQKAGYILWHYKDSLDLSDDFFQICKLNIGKSKRYLYKTTLRNNMVYDRHWRLIVPNDLMSIVNKGVNVNAEI